MSVDDSSDDIGGSGYTLEDLSEYLDRGRTPAIPAIDDNAECQAVLHSLARVRALSGELIAAEAEQAGELDETWVGSILEAISREFRAGADVAYPDTPAGTSLFITEGAIRELVRAAGDAVPGVLIGTTRLRLDDRGDATVDVTAMVPAGRSLLTVANEIRAAIAAALARHSPYRVVEIDVTIEDVYFADADEPGDAR